MFSKQLTDCHESDLLLLIKQHLLVFTYTLEGYGYRTIKLLDLMTVLSARFLGLLQVSSQKEFEKVGTAFLFFSLDAVTFALKI